MIKKKRMPPSGHSQLGTFRGFRTERARLGTFRGFGTERARLDTFREFAKKMWFFYSKRALSCSKTEVLYEKLKTVLHLVILKFLFSTSNFTKFLNPTNAAF